MKKINLDAEVLELKVEDYYEILAKSYCIAPADKEVFMKRMRKHQIETDRKLMGGSKSIHKF